jgi:hypothetical protein
VFDRRQPLPLPPMVFRDVTFEVVHVDEEPCLRADQIGEALRLDPPEPETLAFFQLTEVRHGSEKRGQKEEINMGTVPASRNGHARTPP